MTAPTLWESIEVDAIARGFDHAEYLRSVQRHGAVHQTLNEKAYCLLKQCFDTMRDADTSSKPDAAEPCLFRHKKSGGIYELLATGVALESDQTAMVVYVGTDGRQWVRPAIEFADKFELIDAAPTSVPRAQPSELSAMSELEAFDAWFAGATHHNCDEWNAWLARSRLAASDQEGADKLDAERYRWIRSDQNLAAMRALDKAIWLIGDDFDAAIDTAMVETGAHPKGQVEDWTLQCR